MTDIRDKEKSGSDIICRVSKRKCHLLPLNLASSISLSFGVACRVPHAKTSQFLLSFSEERAILDASMSIVLGPSITRFVRLPRSSWGAERTQKGRIIWWARPLWSFLSLSKALNGTKIKCPLTNNKEQSPLYSEFSLAARSGSFEHSPIRHSRALRMYESVSKGSCERRG